MFNPTLLTLQQKQAYLVKTAKACLGKPYLFGATPEQAPDYFDCSSFTQYLYKTIGVQIPRSTILQAHEGMTTTLDKLQIGDLLFFRGTQGYYNAEFPNGIGHVMIFIGAGKLVQATGVVGKVIPSSLKEVRKRNDLVVIKTILQSNRIKIRQKISRTLSRVLPRL